MSSQNEYNLLTFQNYGTIIIIKYHYGVDVMNLTYRDIKVYEFDVAINLAENVFMEFEAPEYSQDGINAFTSFLFDAKTKEILTNGINIFLVCFDGEKLVGMVAMKSESHVCLAFVDKNYHRMGIATKLFDILFEKAKNNGAKEITLNSSPYGVPFYHAVGFIDTDTEQLADGIRYTPMKRIL